LKEGKAHQEPYSVEESEYGEGRDLSSRTSHIQIRQARIGTGSDAKRPMARPLSGVAPPRASATPNLWRPILDAFGENWPVDYAEISRWFFEGRTIQGWFQYLPTLTSPGPKNNYLAPATPQCAETFDVFNAHHFSTVGISIQSSGLGGSAFDTDVASSTFGSWNEAVTSSRDIQVSGRISF
jgi:hypothetical protein